jgi:hypothetical protein
MAAIKTFKLCITPAEYEAFKAARATKLYDHKYWVSSGELFVSTSRPHCLARDLESVIDFGATSASEVLGLGAVS